MRGFLVAIVVLVGVPANAVAASVVDIAVMPVVGNDVDQRLLDQLSVELREAVAESIKISGGYQGQGSLLEADVARNPSSDRACNGEIGRYGSVDVLTAQLTPTDNGARLVLRRSVVRCTGNAAFVDVERIISRATPLDLLGSLSGPVQEIVNTKSPADGTGSTTTEATLKQTPMFVIVAAGTSAIGCVASDNADLACFNDEAPASPQRFAALEVMRTEVTVAEYRSCVTSGHCSMPVPGTGCNYGAKGKDRHPMNCVSWTEAVNWCDFAKARLPTPDEWERVARGSRTAVFPWGGAAPNDSRANLCDRNCPKLPSADEKVLARSKRIQPDVNDGYAGTAPVGSYPEGANEDGILDLVGNVWEWTDGEWRSGKKERRGGSFIDRPRGLRISNRFGSEPDTRSVHTGFRCVR